MINQAAINKTTTNSQTYLEFEDYEWLGGGDTLPAVPGPEEDPGLFYLTTDESYYIAEPEGSWTLFEYPNYRYFINEDIAGSEAKIQWLSDGSEFYRVYTKNLSDVTIRVDIVENTGSLFFNYSQILLPWQPVYLTVTGLQTDGNFMYETSIPIVYTSHMRSMPFAPFVYSKIEDTSVVIRR